MVPVVGTAKHTFRRYTMRKDITNRDRTDEYRKWSERSYKIGEPLGKVFGRVAELQLLMALDYTFQRFQSEWSGIFEFHSPIRLKEWGWMQWLYEQLDFNASRIGFVLPSRFDFFEQYFGSDWDNEALNPEFVRGFIGGALKEFWQAPLVLQ
jgi:hypothetical protein